MKRFLLLSALLAVTCAEEVRLLDLEPSDAQQLIDSQDQTLKYAPKVDSNVPAVRYLGNEPHQVLEDIYLANQYHGQDGLGGYLYGYAVPDIAKTEKKQAGGDLRGAYNYIAGNGQEIKVEYWDKGDGTGFHQIDNVPKVLPTQIDDTPEVKAAKDEHARLWQEQATRNLQPVQSPYNSEGQYASGPLSAEGQKQFKQIVQQYQDTHPQQQYQPNQQPFAQNQHQYPGQQYQPQPQASQQQKQYQPQPLQPKLYQKPQQQYQPQPQASQQQKQYQPQPQQPDQYQKTQEQYQPQASQPQRQYQPQPQANQYQKPQYQAQQQQQKQFAGGQNVQYQNDQYYQAQQSQNVGKQQQKQEDDGSYNEGSDDDGDDGAYKPSPEELAEQGPPKGFFYKFDYPVGIIVSKDGGSGVKDVYNTNKALFEGQLKGENVPAESSNGYHYVKN